MPPESQVLMKELAPIHPHFVGVVFASLTEVRELLLEIFETAPTHHILKHVSDDQLLFELFFQDGSFLNVACGMSKQQDHSDPLRAGLPRVEIAAASMCRTGKNQIDCVLTRVRAAVQRFSSSEIARVAELNPLLTATCDAYLKAGCDQLQDVNLVFRDHLLIEKFNLVRELVRVGLRPSRCWIIGKEDQSLYSHQVKAAYISLGTRVVGSYCAGEMQYLAPSIIEELDGQKAIVVDDGGDLISAMSQCEAERRMVFMPVETTSKGITKLRRLGIPCLDLATTSIKESLSRQIAVSCVVRARDLLRHSKFSGETCHVLGFGKLGRHVAVLLQQMGVRVSVSDPDPCARAHARKNGFHTTEQATPALAAFPHAFIFGCSGVQALQGVDVECLKSPAFLISASSQDLINAVAYLKAIAKVQHRPGFGDTYTYSDGRCVHVLAHGHAVNLYQAEGVPEPEYDPFTTLLAVTIVELARWCSRSISLQGPKVDVEELCNIVRTMSASLTSFCKGNGR